MKELDKQNNKIKNDLEITLFEKNKLDNKVKELNKEIENLNNKSNKNEKDENNNKLKQDIEQLIKEKNDIQKINQDLKEELINTKKASEELSSKYIEDGNNSKNTISNLNNELNT